MIFSNWIKLLEIKIDSRLNFESHGSDLCESAVRQVNAQLSLKSYLTFEETKILTESFVFYLLPFKLEFYECKSN